MHGVIGTYNSYSWKWPDEKYGKIMPLKTNMKCTSHSAMINGDRKIQ